MDIKKKSDLNDFARAEKTIKILEAQGMTVEAIDYWASIPYR